MQIDKTQLLDLLKSQGKTDEAMTAEAQLPDQVDTDQHAGLLEKLGLSPAELIAKLGGGGGAAGGLGGLLGR